MSKKDDFLIDIVLDCKEMPSIAFGEIEVEGKSIRFGKWIKRSDGLHAIRFSKADVEEAAEAVK